METLLTLTLKTPNPTTHRHTDAATLTTRSGLDYTPAAWDWSGLDLSKEDTSGTTQIRLAATHPAAAALLKGTPATATITEVDEAGATIVFKGKVAGTELDADVLTLKAATAGLTTAQIVPPRAYSSYCQHSTYRGGCGLNEDDWTGGVTVLATSGGFEFTLAPTAAALPSGKTWSPELLQWSALIDPRTLDAALILSNDGWAVTTATPLQLLAGDAAQVRLGCNKLRQGHCTNRFNNAINCSATDLIPTTNPFTQSLK